MGEDVGPMKERSAFRRWAVGLALTLVFGGAGAGASAVPAGAGHPSPLALIPANFAALNSAATARPAPPSQAPGPAPAYAPASGTVHVLGHGAAVAWARDGVVCSTSGIAGGCADPSPSAEHGIDVTLADADQPRQGQPAQVFGLAVDSVARVTVTMKDGTTLSTSPVENWYEVTLPASAATWDVSRVSALTRSGRTIPLAVTLSAPATFAP